MSNTSSKLAAHSRALLLTWLQLVRLPTVFTALSNVLCGYFISHGLKIRDVLAQRDLWLLLGASTGLYLGGMVLNDVCDARLDAVERPERPIPSGRISRRSAAIFAGLLMLGGVVLAALVGLGSLLIAGLIVLAVMLYDGWLKSTMAAPLGMGLCRFLNLMLGASAVPWASLWTAPAIPVAAGLALYIVGVTLFARDEALRGRPLVLLAGLVFVVGGLILDGWTIGYSFADPSAARGAQLGFLLLGLQLSARSRAAISNPAAGRIQKIVGLMLLSVIMRDAIVVFGMTGDPRLSAIIVALIPPAMLLRRFIPMS